MMLKNILKFYHNFLGIFLFETAFFVALNGALGAYFSARSI